MNVYTVTLTLTPTLIITRVLFKCIPNGVSCGVRQIICSPVKLILPDDFEVVMKPLVLRVVLVGITGCCGADDDDGPLLSAYTTHINIHVKSLCKLFFLYKG